MKSKLDPEGLGIVLLGPFLLEFFPDQVTHNIIYCIVPNHSHVRLYFSETSKLLIRTSNSRLSSNPNTDSQPLFAVCAAQLSTWKLCLIYMLVHVFQTVILLLFYTHSNVLNCAFCCACLFYSLYDVWKSAFILKIKTSSEHYIVCLLFNPFLSHNPIGTVVIAVFVIKN